MFKTYMRLLGFARPIKKYAIPYFFYSLFYALFNSLTFMLIIPILNTMFDANYSFEYVEKLPPLELNQDYLATLFNFAYSHIFEQYDRQNVLMLLAIVAICISLMSNLFRYLGAWTMENMRTRTLQRMRNEMFSRVMDMNVGYFSDQRKGDIISKITSDVGVVQFCITNTLQVSFREPFLIIGYIVMMVAISWELAIFSVLFLPVVALLIGSIVKKLRHPARTNQQRMGEMVSTLDESLSGIKVIKSYNATEYIKQKYYAISADLARLTLSMARRQQLAVALQRQLSVHQHGGQPLQLLRLLYRGDGLSLRVVLARQHKAAVVRGRVADHLRLHVRRAHRAVLLLHRQRFLPAAAAAQQRGAHQQGHDRLFHPKSLLFRNAIARQLLSLRTSARREASALGVHTGAAIRPFSGETDSHASDIGHWLGMTNFAPCHSIVLFQKGFPAIPPLSAHREASL